MFFSVRARVGKMINLAPPCQRRPEVLSGGPPPRTRVQVYYELPDGVTDFAPDSFVVLRRDGSHYELMTEGSGRNSPYTSNSPSM